jgi:hypothetical protein
MDQELLQRLDAQDRKLDAIYVSVEKTRKYFLWTFVGTLVAFVIPLLALIFVIPWFLSTMSNAYSGLL